MRLLDLNYDSRSCFGAHALLPGKKLISQEYRKDTDNFRNIIYKTIFDQGHIKEPIRTFHINGAMNKLMMLIDWGLLIGNRRESYVYMYITPSVNWENLNTHYI